MFGIDYLSNAANNFLKKYVTPYFSSTKTLNATAELGILHKCAIYLRIRDLILTGKDEKSDAQKLLEVGHCHSYALIWALAKTNSLTPKTGDIDDIEWFYNIVDSIANWDLEKDKFRRKSYDPSNEGYHQLDYNGKFAKSFDNSCTINEVERFLQILLFLQNPAKVIPNINQNQFAEYMQIAYPTESSTPDEKHYEPKVEFSSTLLIDKYNLEKLLPEIVKENCPVYISGQTHATCIINQGGKYYFFDSNDPNAGYTNDSERIAEKPLTAREAASRIIAANDSSGPSYFLTNRPLTLTFTAINLDHDDTPKNKYPEKDKSFYKEYFYMPYVYSFINKFYNIYGSYLEHVVKEGDLEALQYALDNNFDINETTGTNKSSLLHNAVNYNSHNITTFLTTAREPSININKLNEDKSTPLHLGVAAESNKSVEILLNHKDIDVNIPNSKGLTALHIAASKGYNKIVEMLTSHKDIDVNVRDSNGLAAIHNAAFKSNNKVIEMLINHQDIDVSKKIGDSHNTALTIAIRKGNYEAVKMLVEHKSCSSFDTQYMIITALAKEDPTEKAEAIEAILTCDLDKQHLKFIAKNILDTKDASLITHMLSHKKMNNNMLLPGLLSFIEKNKYNSTDILDILPKDLIHELSKIVKEMKDFEEISEVLTNYLSESTSDKPKDVLAQKTTPMVIQRTPETKETPTEENSTGPRKTLD